MNKRSQRSEHEKTLHLNISSLTPCRMTGCHRYNCLYVLFRKIPLCQLLQNISTRAKYQNNSLRMNGFIGSKGNNKIDFISLIDCVHYRHSELISNM